MTMTSRALLAAALALVSLTAPALDKAALKTAFANKVEALAEKMLPQREVDEMMGFFGPVTKKYLPVFKQFNTEYLAATKKMPVIVKYVPEAESALAEAKAMKVPAKYEAEKAEYIKMASAFVTMLRLSTALYTPQ